MFQSLVLLGATAMLFYLQDLDEPGTPAAAAFLVVVFSAASTASTLVTIYWTTKQMPRRQAGQPVSGMILRALPRL